MKAHQMPIGNSSEWFTPKYILDALGEFDLDPCTSKNRPWNTAKLMYSVQEDGLSKQWAGRVWCNPPFDRYERPLWMKKMADHNDGIMLIPAACETDAFQKYIWGRCDGILFLNKRPHFCDETGMEAKANSGCTICLVAYGYKNFDILTKSKLGIVCTEYNERDYECI